MTTNRESVIRLAIHLIIFCVLIVPVLVFGQAESGVQTSSQTCGGEVKNLKCLIVKFMDLLNPIIALLTGLAVLFFVWGIVQYILYAGDEKKTKSAKNTLVYGVIGLFVLFSFWGIVKLLKDSIF